MARPAVHSSLLLLVLLVAGFCLVGARDAAVSDDVVNDVVAEARRGEDDDVVADGVADNQGGDGDDDANENRQHWRMAGNHATRIRPVQKIDADEDALSSVPLRHRLHARPVLCTLGIDLLTLKGRMKTGTTWTEYIMTGIILAYCRRNPDRCSVEGSPRVFPGMMVSWKREQCTWRFNIANPGKGKLFKHHKLAHDNGTLPANETVVYTARDPRDTVISLCYYIKGDKCEPSSFVRTHFYKTVVYMAENTAIAQELGQLVLPYEGTQLYPMLTMQRLSRFMGMPLPSSELSVIYRQNNFESMRAQEVDGTLAGRKVVPLDATQFATSKAKTRKGKVEGFRDELTEDDIAKADWMMEQYMPPEWYACYISKTLKQPCFPNIYEVPRRYA